MKLFRITVGLLFATAMIAPQIAEARGAFGGRMPRMNLGGGGMHGFGGGGGFHGPRMGGFNGPAHFEPRFNPSMPRPRGGNVPHARTAPGLHPAHHPAPGPHPGPNPKPHPAPKPHPGPGPAPHPGPGPVPPGPGPHPLPPPLRRRRGHIGRAIGMGAGIRQQQPLLAPPQLWPLVQLSPMFHQTAPMLPSTA